MVTNTQIFTHPLANTTCVSNGVTCTRHVCKYMCAQHKWSTVRGTPFLYEKRTKSNFIYLCCTVQTHVFQTSGTKNMKQVKKTKGWSKNKNNDDNIKNKDSEITASCCDTCAYMMITYVNHHSICL